MRYDIELTEQGNTYGFMLSKPEGQGKQLNISEVGPPNVDRLVTTDQLTHLDFPPEVDAPFVQVSWFSGLGQQYFDQQDDKAYMYSTGIITHTDGKAYLAPPVVLIECNSVTGSPNLFGLSGDPIQSFATWWSGSRRYDWLICKLGIWRRDTSSDANEWIWFAHSGGGSIEGRRKLTFFYTESEGAAVFPGDFGTSGPEYVTWFFDLDIPDGSIPDDLFELLDPDYKSATFHGITGEFWAQMYATVRGTLYAISDDHKLFFTVAPDVASSWVGPITVTAGTEERTPFGAVKYAAQNMIAVNDFLFVFNEQAGYSIDADQEVREVLWHFKERPSPLNYKYVATDGYYLYYSIGSEVFAYDPNDGANISVNLARRQGFSTKEILGLAADEKFIYILANINAPIAGGDRTALMIAYPAIDNQGWALEVIWEDDSGDYEYASLGVFPDNDTPDTRIYWGRTDPVADETHTLSMVMPANFDNSGGDSFATSASLYTSITHANFPGFIKRAIWLSLDGQIPEAGSIAVWYSMDEGSTWTQLDFDTSTGGIQNAESSPAIAGLSNDSSRSIMLRFDFTGDGSVTPVLNEFDLHQRVQFRYLQLITCGVRVANNLSVRTGGAKDINRSQQQIKEDLEFLRASENDIIYRDFLGNEFPVTIDKLDYIPTRDEAPTDNWEVEALVRMTRADYGE